jgi:hypothetical protein
MGFGVRVYTWTLSTVTTALGVLAAIRSNAAISAATANATVVKKPKTFWVRTRAECIVSRTLVGFLVLLSIRAHRSAQFGKGLEAGERFVAESIVFVVDVGDAFLSDTSCLRRLLLALSGLSDLLGNGEPN